MARYRRKPVEVDAWQVGSNEPMPVWLGLLSETLGNGDLLYHSNLGSRRIKAGHYAVHDGESVTFFTAEGFADHYEVVE